MSSSKLGGFEFWRTTLRSAKHIVAPMVDQSELPWRMLSRKYGAELCYTPMFHAKLAAENSGYLDANFSTCPEDRPLIVQFCANDPDSLLTAAKMVEDRCDAVDLNLGCPQHIASKGHYGAFLMEEWNLIESMVMRLHNELAVPVTCKIRIFDDVDKTIRYAQMLERAGCQLLTVHGRTRLQKSHLSGVADWEIIRKIVESVSIPVVANGSVLLYEDIQRCLDATGAVGVMSAEGNLFNPTLFAGPAPDVPVWQVVEEYLEYCEKFPMVRRHPMRPHLMKLFRHRLNAFLYIRDNLGRGGPMDELFRLTKAMNAALRKEAEIHASNPDANQSLLHRPWIAQPQIRPGQHSTPAQTLLFGESPPPPTEALEVVKDMLNLSCTGPESREVILERRELKKERRKRTRDEYKSFLAEKEKKRQASMCHNCNSASRSNKCSHSTCKTCCKDKCFDSRTTCAHHRNFLTNEANHASSLENL